MTHLSDAAAWLTYDLLRNGFKGVEFYEARASDTWPEDFVSDGRSRDEWLAWRRDYTLIYLEHANPTFDSDFRGTAGGGDYVSEPEFDEHRFLDDLREHIAQALGPGVTIRQNGTEFECNREEPTNQTNHELGA